MQIRNIKKKTKGHRYTDKEKALALTLYLKSPKVYSFYRKLLILPSRSLLLKWCQLMKINAGLCDDLLNVLETVTKDLPESEKNVLLCLDEMTLREAFNYNRYMDKVQGYEDFGEEKGENIPANTALVAMIRSICGNWKVPVAYLLTTHAKQISSKHL